MNIILNEDFTLKTTKMDKLSEYDLSDINFYIPNVFNSCNCFLCLTSDSGLIDIMPIEFIGNSLSYKKYKVTYSNPIRIKSGKTEIKIILVDSNNHSVCISSGDNLFCNLKIDNYKICHQIAMIDELNLSMKNMYHKMQELTKMNIDIYEKFVEVRNL